jgi:hypothetical protein
MSQSTFVARSGLSALRDVLLLQCGPDEAEALLRSLRPGAGLLVTGARSTEAIWALRQRTAVPLLADRNRYSGTARTMASAALDPNWITRQRAAGVTAPLSDSGYVADGDLAGLRNILQSTRTLGADVVALLPLARSWLTTDYAVLTAEIQAAGVPVALVVEHPDDPFSVMAVVRGFVHLLDNSGVAVSLMRCDSSALGALAFGAHCAAFGVRSSLRHLYELPKRKGGGRFPTAIPTALWQPGKHMVKTDRLAAAVAATPHDPDWICFCMECQGRRLDWLYLQGSHDEATRHNIELFLDERDLLAALPAGPQRRQSWRAMCASAEFQFTAVAAATVGWKVPPGLRHWQQV